MHVVGMLINNGEIDNAVSLPVSISTSTNVDYVSSDIDFDINIPNDEFFVGVESMDCQAP